MESSIRAPEEMNCFSDTAKIEKSNGPAIPQSLAVIYQASLPGNGWPRPSH